ncbi:hypothetical protein [Viscerimonas tarda]
MKKFSTTVTNEIPPFGASLQLAPKIQAVFNCHEVTNFVNYRHKLQTCAKGGLPDGTLRWLGIGSLPTLCS